jgi:hypothetical protein
MSEYLNPSTVPFQQSLSSRIYVDKSGLLACLNSVVNTDQRFVCVSRPRRFGKTMAMKMAAAYYGYGLDSGSLFDGLAVRQDASFAQHLNHYDVLYITMTDVLSFAGDMTEKLDTLEKEIIEELVQVYGASLNAEVQDKNLFKVLGCLGDITGRQFVFLIDEWDCLMRETPG